MRFVLLATLLAGCFFKPEPPSGTVADAAVDGGRVIGGTRRQVTIELTPTVELRDVPISIVMEDLAAAGSDVMASNIAFVTNDDIALPCEIVRYDSAAGSLEAWVRVPVLSAGQRTFQIAYGADVTSACDATSVWADYRGVWHFAEAETAARDSTSYRHDATIAVETPLRVPGLVGQALRLDATDGADMLCAMHTPELDPQTSSFTYETWVRPDVLVGQYDIAMQKGGQSDGDPGFDFELGTGAWAAYVRDQPSATDDYLQLTIDPASYTDTWSHLAIVVDRQLGVITAFFNGALVTSDTMLASMSVSSTTPLCFGDTNTNAATIGSIDEARIHEVQRVPAWIRTTYDNLARRGVFMTISDPINL